MIHVIKLAFKVIVTIIFTATIAAGSMLISLLMWDVDHIMFAEQSFDKIWNIVNKRTNT